MELLDLHTALALSKAIAKTGNYDGRTGTYTLYTDGFKFTHIPAMTNGTSIEVENVSNHDPFICDWVDTDGHSKPCRIHLTRYNFPKKILEIAIQQGVIK